MSGTEDNDGVEARLAELEDRYNELAGTAAMATDLDVVWIIVSAVLVFFMQVGFAMLEVGSVSPKNTKAVLLKNIGDASLGALCWWLVGFALAYGTDKFGFIGTDMFALNGGAPREPGLKEAAWMFDWAFAATSVTIVSGAIAERVKIAAYVVYAIVLTSFIYPMVVHWAWHEDGWASPYRSDGVGSPLLAGCGAVDFAGSGVVHMVGGASALIAARAVKARQGRFGPDGSVCRLPQQSPALQTLGTLILWVGWYAFNAGSSLTVSGGRSVVAARAVVSTTIGPSAGVLVMVVGLKILEKKFDTRGVNNGILSGLVAITAGAPLVNPEGAFVIGVVSAGVYYCSADLLLTLRIDDVVDAILTGESDFDQLCRKLVPQPKQCLRCPIFAPCIKVKKSPDCNPGNSVRFFSCTKITRFRAPVHLFCGMWGMIATGLFTTREGWALTYGEEKADECCGLFYGCGWNLLVANLALLGAILGWVAGTSSILFFAIDRTVGLRVPPNEEEAGMDRTRHSFATGGGHNGGGSSASKHGSHSGGADAVRRAVTKAQWGFLDETSHGGYARSQQSSRAGSLTSSKHGDFTVPGFNTMHGGGGGGGGVGGGKYGELQSWGAMAAASSSNEYNTRGVPGPAMGAGGGRGGASTKHLFPRSLSRGDGAAGAFQLGAAAMSLSMERSSAASEAVTPSAGRHPSYTHGFGGGTAFAGGSNPMHDHGLPGRHDAVVDDYEAAGRSKNQQWLAGNAAETKGHLGVPLVAPPTGRRAGGDEKDWRRNEEKMPDPTEV